MIVITDIKYYTTDSKESMITKIANSTTFERYYPFAFYNNGDPVLLNVVYETINGRRFVDNRRNLDVVVGIKNNISEILCLQYDAFEEMQKRISIQRERIIDQNILLQKVVKSGFFKRLKYLFTRRLF